MNDIQADVVIVGSGVAGALLAASLAGDGVSVAILEAGKSVDRFKAVEKFWNAAIKVPESAYPNDPEAMHPVSNDPNVWYRQSGPEPFRSTYLKVVGGTTWHWLGTTLRFVPNDFKLKSRYGKGVDWPISYDDLEPFYLEAEKQLGVAGSTDETLDSPRSGAYPMPALKLSVVDQYFAKRLDGTPYAVKPTPQARNSEMRDDRPPCCASASCIPICPVQAKYDATVHIKKALAAGAKLHEETTVVALEAGADGVVTAARFRKPDKSEGVAKGKVFIIAAHAIETPRLLLASRSDTFAKGLANRSDQVGRNLMDHPIQLSWAQASEPVYPYRGPLSTAGIETLRDGAFRSERGAFRIEIGNDGWSWPTGAPMTTAQELAEEGLTGDALHKALKDRLSRHIRLASLVEQEPDQTNRVTLDTTETDFYGVPRPNVHFSLSDYVRSGLKAAREAHSEIFAKVGANAISHNDGAEGAGHIIGTTRMGDDPAQSVVDKSLRCHDHRNLFLVGSGVFPTGATANPTLTIAALSLRAAAAVKETLRG